MTMRVAAVLPTCEIGDDHESIRAWSQAAEQLGYADIVMLDHVVGAQHVDRQPPLWGPYDELVPFREPLVLLGFLAAATRTIGLATGILILPQRQTVLVAKQTAEIDLLSAGRLRLGVGTGWNPVEYESLGVPFERRGHRLEAQIELLRRLWSERLVDIDDGFHRVDRAALLPRPHRTIPIWIGGFRDVAIRRAARLADGFIVSPTGLDEIREQVATLRRELERAGRDPATFPIELGITWGEGVDPARRRIDLARELGLWQVSVNSMTTSAAWRGQSDVVRLTTTAAHIHALAQFAELA